ncbi:hypothetical protein ACR9GP_25990 [Enterobacter ludwigii]
MDRHRRPVVRPCRAQHRPVRGRRVPDVHPPRRLQPRVCRRLQVPPTVKGLTRDERLRLCRAVRVPAVRNTPHAQPPVIHYRHRRRAAESLLSHDALLIAGRITPASR